MAKSVLDMLRHAAPCVDGPGEIVEKFYLHPSWDGVVSPREDGSSAPPLTECLSNKNASVFEIGNVINALLGWLGII